MIIDLIVKKELDGYSATVPSIKGFESWADNEEKAIDNILQMSDFYLNIPKEKIVVDKARKENDVIIYKLVLINPKQC